MGSGRDIVNTKAELTRDEKRIAPRGTFTNVSSSPQNLPVCSA
jgi:hypothetical protein